MDLWGQIILAVDIVALIFIMRAALRLIKIMKEAGKRLIHIFPTMGMLIGTLAVNFFGMVTATYAYVRSFNIIYLLLLAVFLLNEFTVFQRIAGIHENGIVLYSKLTAFEDMKKVVWGDKKKKFIELQIKMKDKSVSPLYVNVPLEKREEINALLKEKIK